jgi:hypothetical protein
MGRTNAAVLPVPVLGAAHHVAAGQHARDGLLLDGRGRLVAHGGHAGQQVTFQAELGERRQIDLGNRAGRANGDWPVDEVQIDVGPVLAVAPSAPRAITVATCATVALPVAAARALVAALAGVVPAGVPGDVVRRRRALGRVVTGRLRPVARWLACGCASPEAPDLPRPRPPRLRRGFASADVGVPACGTAEGVD